MRTLLALLLVSAAALAIAPRAQAHYSSVVDMTDNSVGVVETTSGYLIFTTEYTQPSSTSLSNAFLTIGANGSEKGYSTSNTNGVWNTQQEPAQNRELRKSDLATVNVYGTNYYSFVMDLDESSSGKLISLDSLRLYTSNTKGITSTSFSGMTKVFDMDSEYNATVILKDWNSKSDVVFLIPTAALANTSNSAYIYMYQQFGTYDDNCYDYTSSGGVEQTYVYATPVPEVESVFPLSMILGAMFGMVQFRRRRPVAA